MFTATLFIKTKIGKQPNWPLTDDKSMDKERARTCVCVCLCDGLSQEAFRVAQW